MEQYNLVVSNPPHGDVDVARADMSFLGLSPAEVRMKANYGVPEIWFADTDGSTVEDAAASLTKAGLKTALVQGQELAAIPAATRVTSFSLTDKSLVAVTQDKAEIALEYDDPMVSVFCKAQSAVPIESSRLGGRPMGQRMSHSAMVFSGKHANINIASSGSDESLTFLDIYVTHDSELLRLSIPPSIDFSGLGEWQLPNPADNLAMLVAECEERFKEGKVDRRLEGLKIRERLTVASTPGSGPIRKGYSYATKALTELLTTISPDLKGISQPELSSRLAYLTNR